MGKGSHDGNECLARRIALESPGFFRRDDDDLVAAVNGHMLRPLAADTAHKLAEARLGVL
jgi:hypothetical protein